MFWFVFLAIISFGLVVLIGAPYLPTLKSQRQQALKLLALKPGQTLLDLGSGDGRLLLAAAKQGIKSVGIEANPFLFVFSWLITLRYRKLVKLKLGNYWGANWSEADGIYVFLHTRFMVRLHKKIIQDFNDKMYLWYLMPLKYRAKKQ
jgi:hypothetical protein